MVAVVVTFNRLALLKNCIGALRQQKEETPTILVVNNSSTDGTNEWLHEQSDIITVTQENKGGAFGFYTGIKKAFELGAEWIWCMDDDGVPAEDALSVLLNHIHKKPCILSPLVIDINNRETIAFKTKHYSKFYDIKQDVLEQIGYPFNGTMLHRDIIAKVGLPKKELVIWGDESEYWNRIIYKNKFKAYLVRDSHHYHPSNYSLFYLCEWDFSSSWKVYFYVRNKPFVYKSKYNTLLAAYLQFAYFLAGLSYTILRYQKNDKLLKLKFITKAAIDGLKKDTSMSITTVNDYIKKLKPH